MKYFQLHHKFDEMKISVSDEKKRVEDQRRLLEENIADFHRRKAQFEAEKMNHGGTLGTLGKLGKKKWQLQSLFSTGGGDRGEDSKSECDATSLGRVSSSKK